jgi:orotate phosphoribosyltransferase
MDTPPSFDLGALLEEAGAIQRGHFILSSGRHSDVYVEKFRVLERPGVLTVLCAQIAERFAGSGIDLVAGPTTGGIIIAFEAARQLGVSALYVESVEGAKTIRRSAVIPPGSRVLVVDDVQTTGLSLRETIQAVADAGGEPAACAVLIDRSPEPIDFGIPFFAVHRVEAQSWAPDSLPPSLALIPAVKPGTRQDSK